MHYFRIVPISTKFLLLFILLWSYSSYGQTIIISKPMPLSLRAGKFKVLGKNNIGYWVRNYGKNEERIDIYDDEMNMIKSKTLLIKRSNFSTISYFLGAAQATIYYSEFKKKVLHICASNISDKLDAGFETVLDTIQVQSAADNMAVSFASSTNKQYHMFFVPLYEGSVFQAVKIIGTTGVASALYKTRLDISVTGYTPTPQDAIVNNDGQTFLLVKYNSVSNDDIKFFTYVLSRKGELLRTIPVQFELAVFAEPYIIYDEQRHDFMVTSFTADNIKNGANYFSICRYPMDDSLPITYSNYPIDRAIISAIYKGDPGNISGLYTFNIKKVFMTFDRGLYIFSESFFKETKEEVAPNMMSLSPMGNFQPSFNSTRSMNIFHYNDILCLKINDSTKAFSFDIVSKSQSSENDNGAYSSFLLLNNGQQISCLYNSEESSIYTLVENTLAESSNIKQELLNQEKKGIQLIPKMGLQTGLNELVMPSYRNDEFRLIKIKY